MLGGSTQSAYGARSTEHTVGARLIQLPPVLHCCCFPIAWLPQLVSFGSRTRQQRVETAPAPVLLLPFPPRLGPGPWGLGLETAVPTKQLKLRPGEVLAVGRYFGPGQATPSSCFSWESGGRDP